MAFVSFEWYLLDLGNRLSRYCCHAVGMYGLRVTAPQVVPKLHPGTKSEASAVVMFVCSIRCMTIMNMCPAPDNQAGWPSSVLGS